MNRSARVLALALAFAPLAACSAVPVLLGGASIGDAAPQTLADAEKALTLAHLAYQGAGLALQNAASSGALHGAAAASAKALYDKAGIALDAADAADAAANAAGIVQAVGDADALLVQIHALIPQT